MVNRIAELLRENGAVEFGDFTLASGRKSSYYLDVKKAVTHPAVLMAIGEEMARRADFDVVAGVAVGGISIAVATAIASSKPTDVTKIQLRLRPIHGIKLYRSSKGAQTNLNT